MQSKTSNMSPLSDGACEVAAAMVTRGVTDIRCSDGRRYRVAKRFMDVLLTVASLPLWFPCLCLSALLLKLESPGLPAFFVETRTGEKGRRFRMFKMRTMREDPAGLHPRSFQKPYPDPRVTRVGSVLRRTSLDELPQFFNVLRGEMSLVGPRPTWLRMEDMKAWQKERVQAPVGMTGLWQIVARGSDDFDERVRLDLEYLKRRSLRFDVEILLRTVWAVVSGRGAY